MKNSTFITRVVLKNYKSIAACDVQLGPLTFLVGRNGSGKSNFLDALRFVADALNSSLDHAIRDRGGINDVRRRSRGHPNHFSIRLEFALPEGSTGHYAFRIASRPRGNGHDRVRGGYRVQTEECRIQNEKHLTPEEYFRVDERVPLVGIEEPEIALHPGAVGALLDALRDAAHRTQVIITTHSPDLLEDKHLDVDSILAVEAYDGNTVIAPVDEVSRSVVRDKLFTIGELLRIDQLQPDPNQIPLASLAKVKQLDLFDSNKRDTDEKEKKGTRE